MATTTLFTDTKICSLYMLIYKRLEEGDEGL